MNHFTCYDIDGKELKSVYQWDQNRYIEIAGLEPWSDSSVHLNFTNTKHKSCYSVVTTKVNDRYVGVIPNELTCIPDSIVMMIYQTNGDAENVTLGETKISVKPRQMPMDYEYVPTDGVIAIATGFVLENGVLFLADNGQKIGTGARIGGGGEAAPVGDANLILEGVCAGVVGSVDLVTENRWDYWQETNDDEKETATVVAKPTSSCLLLACAMHRGDSAYPSISIDGDGWSKVVDSVPMTLSGGQTQQIAVWSKRVTRGSHAVTVSHDSSRMSLKVIALYEAKNFLNVVANELIGANPYTPPSTTGKRRLYLLSAFYATGSTVVHTANYTGSLDLRSATETRFSVFYDYQPELETTPNFLCNPWYSDMNNCITLDIYDEEAT